MAVAAAIAYIPFTQQLRWPPGRFLFIAGSICVLMAIVATFSGGDRHANPAYGLGVFIVMVISAVIAYKPFTTQLGWSEDRYLVVAGAICLLVAIVATLVGKEPS